MVWTDRRFALMSQAFGRLVHYTREAGVRNLERNIATVMRKAAKLLVSGERKMSQDYPDDQELPGGRKYLYGCSQRG